MYWSNVSCTEINKKHSILIDWVFFVALIEKFEFQQKNFTFFNEIFQKYPDDLKKYVVNKVMGLKKLKKIYKKWQK